MNNGWEGMLPILGTVLVVENDEKTRELLESALNSVGAKSVGFPVAEQAFNYALQFHGHCPLVIVDEGSPGKMQGSDFIKMVRRKWPAVHSILSFEPPLPIHTTEPHVSYIAKPWSGDHLIEVIATSLRLLPPKR